MSNTEDPYKGIKQIFHEPNRLSIMSALCASESDGLTFTRLKEECSLTDGNLNRHLNSLRKAGAVRVEKKFVGVKPRTTVFITESGYADFSEYLSALSEVLQQAQDALPKTKGSSTPFFDALRAKS